MTAPASLPRELPLDGASNVRDLGGWKTRDGGAVRFGRVFRAAALSRLSPAGQEDLKATGLRTVCDFRGVAERARAPSRLEGVGAAVHSLPIEPSVGASLTDILETREATGEDVMQLLRQAYLSYAFEWAHRYRAMFDLILSDGLPLLFHCSAGKDRTGFGAALLLAALDVPWESVMEDYMATNRLWRGDRELAGELPPAVADKLLRVHEELLEAAFDAVRREFGDTDRYLARMLGLDAARRERLRALLVE